MMCGTAHNAWQSHRQSSAGSRRRSSVLSHDLTAFGYLARLFGKWQYTKAFNPAVLADRSGARDPGVVRRQAAGLNFSLRFSPGRLFNDTAHQRLGPLRLSTRGMNRALFGALSNSSGGFTKTINTKAVNRFFNMLGGRFSGPY